MRNDNNAYGSISCVLGFIWVGFIILFFPNFIYQIGWANYFVFPALAIVFGVVGIRKDRQRILSGIGLSIGIIIVVINLILFLT